MIILVTVRNNDLRRLENKSKACMIEGRDFTVCVDPSLPLLNLIGKKYTMMVLGVIGNRGNRTLGHKSSFTRHISTDTLFSLRYSMGSSMNLLIMSLHPFLPLMREFFFGIMKILVFSPTRGQQAT